MDVETSKGSTPGSELAPVLETLKALADESRLTVLGLVATQERSVSELASLLGIKAPTVSHHLTKLKNAGLVGMRADGATHYYRLDTTGLAKLRGNLQTPERVASLSEGVVTDAFEARVLSNFVDGEQLKEIPASRKKRQVILHWLVERFEPAVEYRETQVNEIIGQHHPDFATLRRELIVSGLLTRHRGVYRRA